MRRYTPSDMAYMASATAFASGAALMLTLVHVYGMPEIKMSHSGAAAFLGALTVGGTALTMTLIETEMKFQ